MESPPKIILLIVFLFVFDRANCQNNKAFCKAIDQNHFKQTERILRKVVKKNRNGQAYFNGVGSGTQIDLVPGLDSITDWLKNQDCVEDAYWDKCQVKIDNYPGSSSIGVKFKTKAGVIEKCFQIQEGTTGQANIFGWRPKLFKAKKIFVYKKMYDCKGFIELQQLNCYPNSKREAKNDTLYPEKLIGIWQMIKLPRDVTDKGIEFKLNAQHQLELIVDSFSTYSFNHYNSKTALSGLGYIVNWPPYYCFVKQLDMNSIEVEYESLGVEKVTITYRRKQ